MAMQQQHQVVGQQRQPPAQACQFQVSTPIDTQQQQSTNLAPPMSANIQYLQILATQQQHQSDGQQHQPTAQASQQQASTTADSQQQQSQTPVPQTAASIQCSQQIMAQQQHKLIGQQHQPATQASQLRASSSADTRQKTIPVPQNAANIQHLQLLAEMNQHQLAGQQHQSAAQVSQLRASSFADTQQQQSDIPAPPMTANIQYSPQMDTQQHQMVVQQHHPAAQASQLRTSSSVDTQQQQSPTTHLDRHAMREATAHFDGAPSLIRFDCHLRYQKIIERNELKKQKEEKSKLNKPVVRMEGHVINGLLRDFKRGTRNRAYIEERLKGQPIQIQRLVLPPLKIHP
ncbi:mediator of RNA polymerase II transcription subunit 15-like [Drosophila willistoni]|uniref:mediator of RNA polymerase II transcription subunit 15-like n=1 Tax=Drosophila willistoni TaxID=7260 RepID=UPI001F072EEC|nr:mediator of RNA polymerase II transcription subunit 15-like [Drosophila willistoni]